MFSANSDTPEEDDDDIDEYLQTFSPNGYAVAAAAQSISDDEFPYEVLTADQLVQYMADCIKDVNTVVQVSCSYHSFHVHCEPVLAPGFLLQDTIVTRA